ncbi:DUF5403 family protein [Kribbella sindirgiensis]|uniref:HK97 gp10 family phage protein n=1 Tax=Kribbella sindirgiensis TaxID=1124744 RepID=A0A4R0I082_9ACTN|nr:DUF5403 family protein [Kribbella sindirgiensis]TCC19960.1 hypothetical protein E0H50_37680 [Kribbella sindirgiensis]
MAEVFRGFNGMKFEKALAVEPGVQEGLAEVTLEVAGKAEALLAEHHHDGDAQIDVEVGDVDHYVVLSDERGQLAALSIEFGREPHENEDGELVGGMEGLYILHRAAHLKKRRKRK